MPFKDKEKQKESARRHYEKDKEGYKKKAYEFNLMARKRNREFILSYLSTHPCVDCGEDDIIVLEFDHLRDKKGDVSTMSNSAYSLKRIQEEISKCDVRCANCHRRKTYERKQNCVVV